MNDQSKKERPTVEQAGQEVLKMLNKLRDVAVGNARDLLDKLEETEGRLDSRKAVWRDQEENARLDAWAAREELHAAIREREQLQETREDLKTAARASLHDENSDAAREHVTGLIDVERRIDACGARNAEAGTRYDAALVEWQRTRDKLSYGEVRGEELEARRRSLEARRTLEMRAEQSQVDIVERENLEADLDAHGKRGPDVVDDEIPTEEEIAARLNALRDESDTDSEEQSEG